MNPALNQPVKNQETHDLNLDLKNNNSYGPVSYTHLDVYKRQAFM